MKKIHVIGNSHTAALKEALDSGNIPARNIEVTFFALQQDMFRHARLQADGRFGIQWMANKLDPRERAKILKINNALDTDLSESGVIVRVGVDWNISTLAEITAGYAIPGINDNDLPHRMTRPAFDAMCQALAETTLPDAPLLATGKKILTVLRPLPSEHCFESDDHKRPGLIQLCQDLSGISDPGAAFDALIARIRTLHTQNGCIAIAPPQSARGKACLTRLEYSRNASRLASKVSPSNEVLHMNADYAGLIWDEILEHVNG